MSRLISRRRTAAFLIAGTILLILVQSTIAEPSQSGSSTVVLLHGKEFLPHPSLLARLTAIPPGPLNSTIPPANYDEQLGFTFTQNFSALSYNVTAIEQQDAFGYGPAYLLNGLSNLGYWYQVGLSWDWPLANGGFSSGWAFNYEVFSPNGTSIFPLNSGGLANFTGPISAGDKVELYLNFSGQYVTMQARDWKTASIAGVTFQSFGALRFVGLPLAISNPKGYFTGLMTERYHVAPYNGSQTEVTFSSSKNISSAWMWVDEFNANTTQLVFLRSTTTPVSYVSAPGKLQYFFYEGSILISNAREFVTGTSGSVLLTVSYSQVGGTPPVAPKFVYSSNGSIVSTLIGEQPTTFLVDNGSTWSVSGTISSLSPSGGERWTTPDSSSGLAGRDESIQIVYYHQFFEHLAFKVLGGGSSFGAPDLTFVNYGRPNSIILANSVLGIWVDAATAWNATNPLPGSNTLQRWVSNATTGQFNLQGNVSLAYFHENLVSVGYSVLGGGSNYSAPKFQAAALNASLNQTLSIRPANLWLDYGAEWRVSSNLNGSSTSQRWIAQAYAGIVNGAAISPKYYHQSFVSLGYTVNGNTSGFVPPSVNWTSFGVKMNSALTNTRSIWADYGTPYSYPNLIAGGRSERWVADSGYNGTILTQPVIAVKYETQYYVSILQPSGGGGNISGLVSGWHNSSDVITLVAQSAPGWVLGTWSGSGAGSFSSSNATDVTLNVKSPLVETAVFYTELTIGSGDGGRVSYSFDGRTGTIDSGKSMTVYLSPATVVSLSASSSSMLDLFTNWHGAVNSPSESITVQVHSPEKIVANFGFNYPLMFVSLAALVSTTLLVAVSMYRRRHPN